VGETSTLPEVEQSANPPHGIFFLAGSPEGRQMRTCSRELSPVSPSGRTGCSVRFSVPGVMDRLKGRRGPTTILAEEPKNRDPIAAARSRLGAIP